MNTKRHPLSPWSGSAVRAFTLIELMVAMAVLAVILFVLISITNQTGEIWQHGEGQNQLRSNGRAMLQFISRELQVAVLPVTTPTLGASSPANLQFIANIPPTANSAGIPANLMNPHAIFWQAPVGRSGTSSDIATVGYFQSWDTSNTNNAVGQLCRYYVEATDTSNYLIYSQTAGQSVNWLSNITAVAPGFSAGTYRGWFADNVIAFWVRCLDSHGQPILQTAGHKTLNRGYGFDSRQGYIDSAGVIHPAPALPAAVDIAFATLNSTSGLRIQTPLIANFTDPTTFHQDITAFMNNLASNVKPGAQLFSTTVFLRNAQ